MSEPKYVEGHVVWEGSITTYDQPGSFPVGHGVRIVEVGHMAEDAPTFSVEVARQDCLRKTAWVESVDADVLCRAFWAYINALRASR